MIVSKFKMYNTKVLIGLFVVFIASAVCTTQLPNYSMSYPNALKINNVIVYFLAKW